VQEGVNGVDHERGKSSVASAGRVGRMEEILKIVAGTWEIRGTEKFGVEKPERFCHRIRKR